MNKYLQAYIDDDNNEAIRNIKLALECSIKRRFFELEKNKLFSLATLLDPRYKFQFFDEINVPTVRSTFFLEALKLTLDEDSDSENDHYSYNTISPENTSVNLTTEERTHKDFWVCYKEIAFKKADDEEHQKSAPARELEFYCSSKAQIKKYVL